MPCPPLNTNPPTDVAQPVRDTAATDPAFLPAAQAEAANENEHRPQFWCHKCHCFLLQEHGAEAALRRRLTPSQDFPHVCPHCGTRCADNVVTVPGQYFCGHCNTCARAFRPAMTAFREGRFCPQCSNVVFLTPAGTPRCGHSDADVAVHIVCEQCRTVERNPCTVVARLLFASFDQRPRIDSAFVWKDAGLPLEALDERCTAILAHVIDMPKAHRMMTTMHPRSPVAKLLVVVHHLPNEVAYNLGYHHAPDYPFVAQVNRVERTESGGYSARCCFFLSHATTGGGRDTEPVMHCLVLHAMNKAFMFDAADSVVRDKLQYYATTGRNSCDMGCNTEKATPPFRLCGRLPEP